MSRTLAILGWTSLWSLLSVGGNMTVLADMQRIAVDGAHWMSGPDFVTLVALSRVAPGPNGTVVILLGLRAGGFAGAGAAALGSLLPSSLLAYHGGGWLDRHGAVPWVRALRQALAPVAAGLVLAAGYALCRAVDHRWAALVLTGLGTAAVVWGRPNPLWLIAAGAALGILDGQGGFGLL
ncbi:MAG TPA: chromate transporter [Acetobacteraceae bacterium]|nr:chromate transporter [Acetobacteraceae bacterium]